jgi:hypothetical protein
VNSHSLLINLLIVFDREIVKQAEGETALAGFPVELITAVAITVGRIRFDPALVKVGFALHEPFERFLFAGGEAGHL